MTARWMPPADGLIRPLLNDDGSVGPERVHYGPNGIGHLDDPIANGMNYLATEVLGFCGCGCREAALELVLEVLELISMKRPSGYEAGRAWYREVYKPAEDKAFSGAQAGLRYFVWYTLDDKEITEHGGSVPGWLTHKGMSLLADLRSLKAAGAFEEETPDQGRPIA